MKTIYVKCYSPRDLGMMESDVTLKSIKSHCIKVYNCRTEGAALETYANTMCWWSTILDDEDDIAAFVDKAANAIMTCDWDWLEANFV